MKYHLVSKKTLRNKDRKALENKTPGYLCFKAPYKDEEHRYEVLYRTTRGWFLKFFEEKKNDKEKLIKEQILGEVSITTAQTWLEECGINYSLGW